MAARLPKRVKDLPPLEAESEDELKTPAKSRDSNSADFDTFGNIRIPKKVAELSPLESDSDDESRLDRLNCAILNDSFILSPTKSVECETPLRISEALEQTEKRKCVVSPVDELDSFSSDFKKLDIEEKENSPVNNKQREPKSRHALFPDPQDKELPKQNLSISHSNPFPIRCSKYSKPEISTKAHSRLSHSDKLEGNQSSVPKNEDFDKAPPLSSKPPSVLALKEANVEKTLGHTEEHSACPKGVETPFKPMESNFVTPQVKYQMPTSRRPNFSTNTSQKSRSALENEFRSQKILFRTPITMSRPPSLVNNSINLLDDTVKEKETTPREGRLSPVKEMSAQKSLEAPDAGKSKEIQAKKVPKKLGSGEAIVINGNEYNILKKLGSGGSSSVFLAQRGDNQKECALKIVDLHGERGIVEGYLNETKLLARLQGNANVVSLYEYQHLPERFTLYMVMEKGDSDLSKILQSYQTDLPLYVLTNFWYQMLQSVNYIHENGVIHSDLKPANFLMVNGRLKLIDFGIASNIAIDSTSIIKFSQAGTFNYISPEALIDTSTGNSPLGKNCPKIKISTKSDVWSLGCILYLLLYKKTPFGHIKNIYAKVNAISNPATTIEYPALSNYYPPVLLEMVRKCLQHNPKQRSSVSDLLKYPFEMLIPIPDKP